jgi:hypothetical protein
MESFEDGARFSEAKEAIRLMIEDAFPDKELFHERVRLAPNTENRAFHIAFDSDWYYVDDFAIEYYRREPHHPAIENFLNRRILQCDPFDDGQPLLDFLHQSNSLD